MANNGFVKLCVPSSRRITTVESLREHLQCAIELEHFTLPRSGLIRKCHTTSLIQLLKSR